MPRDAIVLLLSHSDSTLQPTVGKCVALVELETSLICEEAAPGFWQDVSDSIGGNNFGREVDKVLVPSLKWDTLVLHHGELFWLSDEHLESVVLLVKGAQGHRVGVEV